VATPRTGQESLARIAGERSSLMNTHVDQHVGSLGISRAATIRRAPSSSWTRSDESPT
jgi:hypothetical protein